MNGLIRGWTKHLTPRVGSAYSSDPLDYAVRGEWRFVEDTGVLLPDYSGEAHHAAFQGTPAWTSGQYGRAFDFQGGANDYFLATDPATRLNPGTGSVVLELFVYLPAADSDALIFGGWHDGAEFPQFCIGLAEDETWAVAGRKIVVWHRQLWNRRRYAATVNDIADGNWHHIIANVDSVGDAIEIYVDGVSQTLTTDNQGVWPDVSGASDFYIGGLSGGGATCQIALGRYYHHRILSVAEARARHQICLKRGQPMTHTWTMPWGFSAVRIPRHPAHYNPYYVV